MPLTLGQQTADSAWLLSVVKPLVFWLFLTGWAYVTTRIDKDLQRHFLPQGIINSLQIALGFVSFGLWILLGGFWLGLLVAVVLILGGWTGYFFYHNSRTEPKDHWRLSLDLFRARYDQVQQTMAQRRADIVFLGKDGEEMTVPAGADPMAEAHATIENVLNFALPVQAERIDIAANAQQGLINVWIDGVKYPQPKLDGRAGVTLIDYLRQQSGMDLTDRRRRQTATCRVAAGDHGKVLLRMAFEGSTRGMSLSVEVNPKKQAMRKLDSLGLLDSQRKQIQPILDAQKGVVIVAAPPDHGLTTTMHALLNHHDPYTQSIIALQDESTEELEGVDHQIIEPGATAEDVLKKLRGIFRQDPHVVMVSRLTDPSHARAIADAAENIRVYVGIRQGDTFSALKVWLKAVGDVSKGASVLQGVIAQRLVRKLCETCRVAYAPDPSVLKRLNLSTDRVPQLYKESGKILVKNKPQPCPVCMGLSFRGRMGVFETMVPDDAARELLAAGQMDQYRAHLRRGKMLWLQEAGLSRVVEGQTSIAELTKVLSAGETKKTAKSS